MSQERIVLQERFAPGFDSVEIEHMSVTFVFF